MGISRRIAAGIVAAVTAALTLMVPAATPVKADTVAFPLILDGAEVLNATSDVDGLAQGDWFSTGADPAVPTFFSIHVTLANVGPVQSWGVWIGHLNEYSLAPVFTMPVAYNAAGELAATYVDPQRSGLFQAMKDHPEDYYVQITTSTGSIRSQLGGYTALSLPVLLQTDPSLQQPGFHDEVACGPTSATMVLQLYYSTFTFPGLPSLTAVYNQESVYNGKKAVGWSIAEIEDVFTHFGPNISTGQGYAAGVPIAHNNWGWALGAVRRQLAAGHPVIALIGDPADGLAGWKKHIDGHWIVITGFDETAIYYSDPAFGPEQVDIADFQAAWGSVGRKNVTVPYQGVTSTPD